MPPTTARLRGLDTLRALAIALVFAFHYQVFISEESTFGAFGDLGWVGVDLFFVLSGYLVANQLFDPNVQIGRFYLRRALRTLPSYLVVLALYFSLPGRLGGRTPPPLWRFLTFTQNFSLEPGTAFSHAWSLCIEEQFYLMLPLVVLVGAKVAPVKLWVRWLVLLSCIAAAVVWRSLQWARYDDPSSSVQYMQYIYYSSWCRLDELLPGVALAMVKHFHPAAWRALLAKGQLVFVVSSVATAAMLAGLAHSYQLPDGSHGYFMTAFGYSLLAICFAGLTLAALSPTSALARWRIPGAGALATGAYTVYLTHKAVGHLMAEHLLPRLALSASSWVSVGLITLASAVAGWLLHTVVEAPALRYRDRRWALRRGGS